MAHALMQLARIAEAHLDLRRVHVHVDARRVDADEQHIGRLARAVQHVLVGRAQAVRDQANGLVVLSSPLIYQHRSQIGALSLSARLPTISLFNTFPKEGGLMAYGPDFPAIYTQAAGYVGRVLAGANPGELPIQRPTKFELVINLKTAKALGLDLPPTLLARADEVIE